MTDLGAASRVRSGTCRCPIASLLAAIALGVLAGCDEDETEASRSPLTAAKTDAAPPQPPAAEAVAPAKASQEPAAELVAGTFLLQSDVLRSLERAKLAAVRPVGSTSTVFRTELDQGIRAAFKVATWMRPGAALNEVAAYRLARCLGLSNVPPAILRRMPKEDLRHRLDASFIPKWPPIVETMVTDKGGVIEGALIYWVDELQDLGLEDPSVHGELFGWLKVDAEPPPDQQKLAMQLSTVVAFDYLIGNWDRWSGGNLKGDGTGEVLYMRDHDAAFARVSEPLLRRMLQPVLQTERYSRSFVTALRGLTREAWAAELARDPELAARDAAEPQSKGERLRKPVLDEADVDRVFDRRDTLLTHIAALIEEHGEAKVLSFP